MRVDILLGEHGSGIGFDIAQQDLDGAIGALLF